MPTGVGKSTVAAALIGWPGVVPGAPARILTIAHREELLEQMAARIIGQNPHLRVSIEQADRYANGLSDVVVASIQTLSGMKFRRLKRLLERGPFNLVIIDEAHHAAASTYRTALVHLGFLPPAEASEKLDLEAANFEDVADMEKALLGWDDIAPKDRLLVGFTATPNRSDAIGLGCVFQRISVSYGLKKAIEDKWLVPITPWVVETDSNLDDVRMNRGEFNQRDLADAVNNEPRNLLAVAAWREHAPLESTLAFTVDVAHAHALAAAFQNDGVNARALSGETPKDERRAILAAYTAGTVQVITNCMVLTEGTDLPRTGCILHAKPTKSATLYEQMTGRGLRIHPGKTECIVIDLVDVARRHSLQSSPVLYGLPPGLKAQGKKLDELAAEYEELLAKYPHLDPNALGHVTLEQLRAHTATFDIWSVPEMGEYGTGLTMNWIRTSAGGDTFKLQYPWQNGSEILSVEPNLLGKYDLVATFRLSGAPGTPALVRQRTVATGIETAPAALRVAEVFVAGERSSVVRLKDREAPWRTRPISPKQISLLRRLRVPFNEGITMGAASDLIDLAQSRKGR